MLELHLSEPTLVGLYNLSDEEAGKMVKSFVDYMLGRGTPVFNNQAMIAMFHSFALLDSIKPLSNKETNKQEG